MTRTRGGRSMSARTTAKSDDPERRRAARSSDPVGSGGGPVGGGPGLGEWLRGIGRGRASGIDRRLRARSRAHASTARSSSGQLRRLRGYRPWVVGSRVRRRARSRRSAGGRRGTRSTPTSSAPLYAAGAVPPAAPARRARRHRWERLVVGGTRTPGLGSATSRPPARLGTRSGQARRRAIGVACRRPHLHDRRAVDELDEGVDDALRVDHDLDPVGRARRAGGPR